MKRLLFLSAVFFSLASSLYAQSDLTEAASLKGLLAGSEKIETKIIKLTKDQRKAIEEKLGRKISQDEFTFYLGKTEDNIDAYCFSVYEQGKHGPISFGLVITPAGEIRDIVVLKSRETKGAKIGKKRFLGQFIGKSYKDPIKLRQDIDAVTGATVSSQAAVRAVKKALVIWEVLFF